MDVETSRSFFDEAFDFHGFPKDVIEYIFGFLSAEDIGILRLTCKPLHNYSLKSKAFMEFFNHVRGIFKSKGQGTGYLSLSGIGYRGIGDKSAIHIKLDTSQPSHPYYLFLMEKKLSFLSSIGKNISDIYITIQVSKLCRNYKYFSLRFPENLSNLKTVYIFIEGDSKFEKLTFRVDASISALAFLNQNLTDEPNIFIDYSMNVKELNCDLGSLKMNKMTSTIQCLRLRLLSFIRYFEPLLNREVTLEEFSEGNNISENLSITILEEGTWSDYFPLCSDHIKNLKRGLEFIYELDNLKYFLDYVRRYGEQHVDLRSTDMIIGLSYLFSRGIRNYEYRTNFASRIRNDNYKYLFDNEIPDNNYEKFIFEQETRKSCINRVKELSELANERLNKESRTIPQRERCLKELKKDFENIYFIYLLKLSIAFRIELIEGMFREFQIFLENKHLEIKKKLKNKKESFERNFERIADEKSLREILEDINTNYSKNTIVQNFIKENEYKIHNKYGRKYDDELESTKLKLNEVLIPELCRCYGIQVEDFIFL